jgi:hypothetical protein
MCALEEDFGDCCLLLFLIKYMKNSGLKKWINKKIDREVKEQEEREEKI